MVGLFSLIVVRSLLGFRRRLFDEFARAVSWQHQRVPDTHALAARAQLNDLVGATSPKCVFAHTCKLSGIAYRNYAKHG
jgi:hypothetical protein